MRHNFVALNGHLPICCFLGISLVPNDILSDKIEHLSRIVGTAKDYGENYSKVRVALIHHLLLNHLFSLQHRVVENCQVFHYLQT